MKITIAKNIGFCFGVSNAVTKTMQILDDTKQKIYCLGELVHNKDTINSLKERGLIIVENIKDVKENSTLIIRAHGVTPSILKEAQDKGIKVIDLTCPKVAKVHELVSKHNDYFIILIGNRTHPEVIGTIGYAKKYCVVENEADALKIKDTLDNYTAKVFIYSQTTFSNEYFKELTSIIKNTIDNELEILSCICQSTQLRQDEVIELSKANDLVIVVGGKNSSNTEKLYKIASRNTKTIWIENVLELDQDIKKHNNIALVSGASTSMDTVNDIYNYLKQK